MYVLLRALLRHALRVFFRRLEVEGLEQVPSEGPLLLAANHPNTLIDVLLVATYLDRRVGFVAKSTLFEGRLAGALLRALGAVPVYRREDAPLDEGARARNRQALAACEEAVAAGRAILIFPEGVSQEQPRLMELKTGLARMALGAEARAPGEVAIVPVGLVYDDPETFRSRAHVRYGAPIRVAPFRDPAVAPDDPRQVRALTEAVRSALLATVVHVERSEHDPLVRDLDAVYGGEVEAEAGSRLAATAAIARAVNAFAERDPARVERVRGLLSRYRTALSEAGVDDAAVRARTRRVTIREAVGLAAGAPFALWGILNHLVLYHVPRVVLRVVPVDPVYSSTVKLLTGLLALVACYALQGWAAHEAAPLVGLEPAWAGTLAYVGTLPLTGLLALVWLEAAAHAARRVRLLRARSRLTPDTLRRLREQRAELMGELERAQADYLTEQVSSGAEEEPGTSL